MSLSLQDSHKYMKAVADLAHLINIWGPASVLLDLKIFFPDEYDELFKEFKILDYNQRLSRLVDASESRRERARVVHDSLAVERSDSSEGNK